jgi:hypothetical protein
MKHERASLTLVLPKFRTKPLKGIEYKLEMVKTGI